MSGSTSSSSTLRKVIIAGALGAVSIVLILTPIGVIPWFAGVSLTVMHIPAIIGAVLEGPVVGLVVGAIFGLCTLVRAAVAPNVPFDLFFVNPIVSVLPRILFPLLAWLVYRAFRGKLTIVAAAAAGIAGSLGNSVLVLGALVLVGALQPAVAASVFVANSLIEAAGAAVLTAAVVAAWKGIESRTGRSKLAEEEGK